MTIVVMDRNGTNVHTYHEKCLFVAHPYHDVKVSRHIELVRSNLESENDTEFLMYSFGCESNLRALDPPWGIDYAPIFGTPGRQE